MKNSKPSYVPYLELGENIVSFAAKIITFFLMSNLLCCIYFQSDRLKVTRISKSILVYIFTHAIISPFSAVYSAFMIYSWIIDIKPATKPICLLNILTLLPLVHVAISPIPVLFLTLDRCLSLRYPLHHNTKRRKILCVCTIVLMGTMTLFSSTIFITQAILSQEASNLQPNCFTAACFLIKYKSLLQLAPKIAFGSLNAAISFYFFYLLNKERDLNIVKVSNTVVKVMLYMEIGFTIIPTYISYFFNLITGVNIASYIGQFAGLCSLIDIALCRSSARKMSTNYNSIDELQAARENIWKKEMDEERNYQLFDRLYILLQVLMFSSLVLIASWMGFYGGGFGFQNEPKQEFRWHPLLMSIALLFINGEAILMYRGFRYHKKVYTKTIHGGMQACGVVLMLLGLKAVYDSHNLNRKETGEQAPITNFVSVHSWVGLLAMGLYALQWAMGFTFFVLPAIPMNWRKGVLPSHRLTGVLIFLTATCASLMGISEHSAWSMTCWTENNKFCSQMLVANLFALVIVSYSAIVLFLVSNPFWARQPLPSKNEEAPVYSHGPLNKKLLKDN